MGDKKEKRKRKRKRKKSKKKRNRKRKKSKKKRNRKRKKTKKQTKKEEEDETHEEVGVDEHEADIVQLIWQPSGLIFGTGRFEPHYVASNKANEDSMSDEIGLSDQNPFDRSWYTAAR